MVAKGPPFRRPPIPASARAALGMPPVSLTSTALIDALVNALVKLRGRYVEAKHVHLIARVECMHDRLEAKRRSDGIVLLGGVSVTISLSEEWVDTSLAKGLVEGHRRY
eukprot:CAMPEP_0174698418 /NCGR_PEP_ID=MMETSP1094-20130205/4025_1 /TAXON_ID=156173 /ORGANISM="Chrysochromulina brevifilum, Strain UTEX LB 985" /LENGTH=108 /DNA_ID=CAMNT_0015895595 /DNA_START=367 /DNA_END=693 /DNA_ORIENTATION=+